MPAFHQVGKKTLPNFFTVMFKYFSKLFTVSAQAVEFQAMCPAPEGVSFSNNPAPLFPRGFVLYTVFQVCNKFPLFVQTIKKKKLRKERSLSYLDSGGNCYWCRRLSLGLCWGCGNFILFFDIKLFSRVSGLVAPYNVCVRQSSYEHNFLEGSYTLPLESS